MKHKQLEKRINDLETKYKAVAAESVFIDMNDNKVQIIKGKNYGQIQEFETVRKAADYVEEWMAKSEKVCGICQVSNVLDPLSDRPLTEIPDWLVNFTGVIMNLVKVRGNLAGAGLATWLFLHPEK